MKLVPAWELSKLRTIHVEQIARPQSTVKLCNTATLIVTGTGTIGMVLLIGTGSRWVTYISEIDAVCVDQKGLIYAITKGIDAIYVLSSRGKLLI